ncbi:hypothetical protein MKW98_031330 [Papaver atlanticum]|uniref:Antimicrobial peptide 1 n=1 Tax=Papaver atlanticum TaxID=357466 RepID=A0AAD4X9H6_9MAGN|nr:hypothetical protein MKW98_031330 [Papaver atlanticum]
MAATTKSVSMLIMALVLMAVASELANASSIIVFAGPGCNNRAQKHLKCGCSNISLRGGYEFTYGGQSAAMYWQSDCEGASQFILRGDSRSCDAYTWKSMFIQC